MLQIIVRVGCAGNGSIRAVSGWGTTSRSASLMARQPTTLDPSKRDSLLERLLGQGIGGNREMLPDAGKIHEPQVNRGDLALPDLRQDFFGSQRNVSSCRLAATRGPEPCLRDLTTMSLGVIAIMRASGRRRKIERN